MKLLLRTELDSQRGWRGMMGLRHRYGEVKYDIHRELSAAMYASIQIAPKVLASFGSRRRAAEAAPDHQPMLCWSTLGGHIGSLEDLRAELTRRDVHYVEGRHTLYVPPQRGRAAVFGALDDAYPGGAGFKLLKHLAPPDSGHYLHDARRRWITSRLMGGIRQRTDAANLLYALDFGPKLYDTVEVRSPSIRMTCFVVEHVTGAAPTADEYVAFIARFRQLLAGDLGAAVALATPFKLRHRDFQPPDCNGNLIKREADGALLYVDFQPFMLIDRGRVADRVLDSGGLDRQRGMHAVIARQRWSRIAAILDERGLQVRDRVLLDLDCQSGFMLAGALAAGARWAIGWTGTAAHRAVERYQALWGNTRLTVLPAPPGDVLTARDRIPLLNLDEAIVLVPPAADPYLHHSGLAGLPWRGLIREMDTSGAGGRRLDVSVREVGRSTV